MIRAYQRCISFLFSFLFFLNFGLQATSWREQSDMFVARGVQSAQPEVRNVISKLHDAQSFADVQSAIQLLERIQCDTAPHWREIGVKIITASSACIKKHLLKVIQKIDDQVAFCTYRISHPAQSCLYRSPTNWFESKTNFALQQEINELLAQKDHYLQTLGSVLQELESFPSDTHEITQWISKVLTKISGRSETSITSNAQLVEQVKQVFEQMKFERTSLNARTAQAVFSGNIEAGLHWAQRAAVLGAIAFMTGVGYFYGQCVTDDSEKELQNIDDAFASKMKSVVADIAPGNQSEPVVQSAAEPAENFVSASSHEPSSGESSGRDAESPRGASPEVSTVVRENQNPVAGFFNRVGNKAKNALKETAQELKDALADKNGPARASSSASLRASKPNSVESLPAQKFSKPGLSEQLAASAATGAVRGAMDNPEVKKGLNNFNSILEKVNQKLDGVTADTIFKGASTSRKMVRDVIKHEMLSKVGFIISGSALAAGFATAAYYIKRIASKYGKTHTAMKQGILDIAHILARYGHTGHAMTVRDLGEITYLSARVSECACRVLSQEEAQLLSADLAQLQSSAISISSKNLLLQRMYGTYSFLVPSRALII